MGWLKKVDPVTDRTRALNSEIAALERQIGQLHSQLGRPAPGPRLRSTALPSATAGHRAAPADAEPIFEDVNQDRLKAKTENLAPQEHFNELGVRKYDLIGLLARVKAQFHGPSAANPRLVNYLAAGGVQGLRPMRYEKRVARNRLLALVAIFLVILIGILSVVLKNH
jgi:hypothetical protein